MQPVDGSTKRSLAQQYDAGMSQYFQAETLFKTHCDPEQRVKATERMTRGNQSQSTQFLSTAGAMFLEIACDPVYDADDRLSFVDKAKQLLEQVVVKEPLPHSQYGIRSGLYLANIGIFQAMAIDEQPPSAALDDAYERNLQFGETLRTSSERYSGKQEVTGRLKGIQAELAVIALLQRFERTELQDGSWLSVPAHFSQKESISAGGVRRSWDVSGYTSLDGEKYDLSYLLQVQAYLEEDEPKRYTDDITIVSVGNDLAYRNGSRRKQIYPPYRIVDELIAEARYGLSGSVTLDQRTEQLLELIG